MRRLVPGFVTGVLASTCCVVAGSVAFGANLPVKAPRAPNTYFTAAPVATWSGFYGGANFGWGWAKADATVLGVSGSTNLNGAVGGLQLGYNFQSGPLVFGAEVDGQASDIRRNDTLGGGLATATLRIPYFFTFRGRLGYATDNWLFYVTGGAAWSKYTADATVLGVTSSAVDYRWGWAVGGGIETMFASRWSGKLEYLYMDTGNYTSSLFGVPYTARVRNNILRIGANYHF